MPDNEFTSLDLALLRDRFPEDALLIEQLFVRDEEFRLLCEDYVLSRYALARFEAAPDNRPVEIADYRVVVVELEQEIRDYLGQRLRTASLARRHMKNSPNGE